MMAALVKHRIEGLLPCTRLAFFRFYSQSIPSSTRFTPPKNTISPFIKALSRYYHTPPAIGLQGKYATLVRELSEFGDTVGVLDAHHALIRRNVPFHFDVFQTMLHHFARIGDIDQCFRLLNDTITTFNFSSSTQETLVKGSTQEHLPKGTNTKTKLTRKMLYNAMLLALIENKQWKWYDQVIAQMQTQKVHWDEATCLLMARMRLQSGKPEQLKDVLESARARSIISGTLYNYVLMHTLDEGEKQSIQSNMASHNVPVADVSDHPLLKAEPIKPLPTRAVTKPIELQAPVHKPQKPEQLQPQVQIQPQFHQQLKQPLSQPQVQLQPQFQQQLAQPPSQPQQQLGRPLLQQPDQPIHQGNAEKLGAMQPTEQTKQLIMTNHIIPPNPNIEMPPFPMPPPFPNAMFSPYPYPPPFSYPEYYSPPSQEGIILNFNSPPPRPTPLAPTPAEAQGLSIFRTREEYNQALTHSTHKDQRQALLRDMLRAKLTPDESTVKALMASYKGSAVKASSVWRDFASVNCEQVLPLLVPFIIPASPFNWRHVVAVFKNESIRSSLAYDELLKRVASQPESIQDIKDLLVVMAEEKIPASKEAVISALSFLLRENIHDLESLLPWLLEHGVYLDHIAYCDLTQRISTSSSTAVIKRDAILFLHRTMKQRRIVPDYTFFALAFHWIMACSDPEPCAPLLLSVKSAGVRMDQPLYSLLTVFLLRCGEVALAEQVDEDMRTSATDQQIALHYGYLRAFMDRGELAGVHPNTVVPSLEVYYRQQSVPYPIRLPHTYPLPPLSIPTNTSTSPVTPRNTAPQPSIRTSKKQRNLSNSTTSTAALSQNKQLLNLSPPSILTSSPEPNQSQTTPNVRHTLKFPNTRPPNIRSSFPADNYTPSTRNNSHNNPLNSPIKTTGSTSDAVNENSVSISNSPKNENDVQGIPTPQIPVIAAGDTNATVTNASTSRTKRRFPRVRYLTNNTTRSSVAPSLRHPDLPIQPSSLSPTFSPRSPPSLSPPLSPPPLSLPPSPLSLKTPPQ